MTKIIVMSESADWYLIPADKYDQWQKNDRYSEENVDYVIYISDPSSVQISEYCIA